MVIITGYLLPWSTGQPIDFAGLFDVPSPLPRSRGFYDFLEEAHEISGRVFVPLAMLHILGAAQHHFIDKDDLSLRMVRPTGGSR